ncbi:hypothetical protein HMPREF0240_03760 [Clostridium sp. D5]|nr:hypothetical protein HMPREF0240_03760 [Clostridium sp. D5]
MDALKRQILLVIHLLMYTVTVGIRYAQPHTIRCSRQKSLLGIAVYRFVEPSRRRWEYGLAVGI